MACAKCHKIVDGITVFQCDKCKKQFCKDCSQLRPTEIKVLQLLHKSLIFFCTSCQNENDDLNLQKTVETANKTILDLNKKITNLTSVNTKLKNEEKENEYECGNMREEIQSLKKICAQLESKYMTILVKYEKVKDELKARDEDIRECENIYRTITPLKQSLNELQSQNNILTEKLLVRETLDLSSIDNFETRENPESLKEHIMLSNVSTQTESKMGKANQVESSNMEKTSKVNQRKILIIADENGKGLSQKIKKMGEKENTKLLENYDVTSIIKSGASIESVLAFSTESIKHLTDEDFVIISTGANDSNPSKVICELGNALNRLRHTNVTSADLNLLTMYDLYILRICLYIKKNPTKYEMHNHNHDTRNKEKFKQAKHSHTHFQKGLHFSSINIFNKLPPNIRETADLNSFKKLLTAWLKQETFYDLAYFNILK